MRKIYFLFLLLCAGFAGNAQTDTIWAKAASLTFTTGSAIRTPPTGSSYTRNDGIIAIANNTTTKQTGYAVFDLSGIPAGAVISYVELGCNVFGYTSPTGTGYTFATYGRDGSLATETNATNLYNYCLGGSGGVLLSTASYGTGAPYDWSISGGSLQTFIASRIASSVSTVSISFSMGGSTVAPVYNMTGETGSKATAGPHAPYLIITYCTHPIINTANVSPTPICAGQTFSLTGSASYATGYRWRGPAGFMTTMLNTTAIANASSAGTYTLTAYTACGPVNDSTLSTTSGFPTTLSVNPSPAALVTTTITVCTGNTIYLSDVTPGGAWSSSNNAQATVNSTGTVVAGSVKGTPVISYKLGSCAASVTVTVNEPPGPILGAHDVCASGGTIALSNAVTGIPNGTWTSSITGVATVDPVTGVVTGVLPGLVDITYLNGGCPVVTHSVTVNPLPNAIVGNNIICANATLQLSDVTPNGTWTSSNTALATVEPTTGLVWGVSASATPVDITYTLPTGCYVTHQVTVLPIPDAITGPTNVCVGQVITLSDATPGGTWASSSLATATVGSVTGVVTAGIVAGPVTISYTLSSLGNCYNTHLVTVDPLPSAIAGLDQVCANDFITLSDSDPGGQWSSGTTSVATAEPATGNIWGVTAGSAWITYTFTGTGCYISHSVTVLPQPTAIITAAGPVTFCTGGSVTLDATPGPGYNFSWFSNHTPTGLTGPSYVSNSTEVVNVQVTDGNGCIKMSDSVQVTLIPSVAIVASGPTVFCAPHGVVLSVPLAPMILYQWKLNGVDIPGANAHTFTAVADGIYSADLVIPSGCASTTPDFPVTVHPMPVPVITYTGSLLTTLSGYINYQWFLNTVAIPGATSTSVTPTVNGSYIVRVEDGNGCIGYSTAYIFNLGVASVSAADVSIYPNPANSVVNIDAPADVRAVITSIDGKTIIDQEKAKKIDISKLADGLYMIAVYNVDGERILIQKLVKQ